MSNGESGGMAPATDRPQTQQDSGSYSSGVDGFNSLASMCIGGLVGGGGETGSSAVYGGPGHDTSGQGTESGSNISGSYSSGADSNRVDTQGTEADSDIGGFDSGSGGQDRWDAPGTDNRDSQSNGTFDASTGGKKDDEDRSKSESDGNTGSDSGSKNNDHGTTDRPRDEQMDNSAQVPGGNPGLRAGDLLSEGGPKLPDSEGGAKGAREEQQQQSVDEGTGQSRTDNKKGRDKKTFLGQDLEKLLKQRPRHSVSTERFLPGNEKAGQRLSDGKGETKSWDQTIAEFNQMKEHGDTVSAWNSEALKAFRGRQLNEPGSAGNIAREEHKISHPEV